MEVQVSVDSSEMMKFEIYVPKTDESIEKTLDTTPRFNSQDANALITKYAEHARQTLDMLETENVAVEVLKNRLYALRSSRRHTETKAIVEQYKELLRDIYRLECDTAWERIIRKVEKEMALLKLSVGSSGDDRSKYAFHYLEVYIESARENHDVAAAKKILEEVELLGLDLRWKSRLPSIIRWYDHNFDNVAWSDKEHARWCIDEALKLIGKEFTKEEVTKAFRRILSAKESMEEIREAEGLLG